MRSSGSIIPLLLICILCVCLSGCIHTYPEGDGTDPTLVRVGVEVELDISWETKEIPFTKSQQEYEYRLVIEFTRNGENIGRCEHHLLPEELANNSVRLIMPFEFRAVNYQVTAWLDCCDPQSFQDIAYDTKSLSSIVRTDNHLSWDEKATCAFVSSEINLQKYKDQWGAQVVVPLSMSSPLGRFRIIAEDMEEFLGYISKNLAQGETYSICLSFARRVPRGFDAIRNEAISYLESPEYYFPLLPENPTIADGAVFVDREGAMLTASVLVYNSARVIVSKSPEITFPLERGKLTVVTGALLTDYYTNSLNVNNIWDGEIIIEI